MRSVAVRVICAGRLRAALSAYEVERTAEHVVLSIPVGSPGLSRRGPKGGPRGAFLRREDWEPGLHPRPWRYRDVTMVHRFSDEWSTWRWLDEDRNWTPGAYVNLERRWTIGPRWYDTDDLTLDVVVEPDGSITLKDEDELAWAEGEGIYSAAEATAICDIGQRAIEHVSAGGWPLGVDWDPWRLPAGLPLPQLPDGWDDQLSERAEESAARR